VLKPSTSMPQKIGYLVNTRPPLASVSRSVFQDDPGITMSKFFKNASTVLVTEEVDEDDKVKAAASDGEDAPSALFLEDLDTYKTF
jgi:hypothetical protein